MITFKSVRYKNFLSSGNVFTQIDLDRSKVQKLIQEVYQEACELV